MSTTVPVVTGSTFVASIPVPPGPPSGLGAQIEVPGSGGAIVTTFQLADILTETAQVSLEAPPTAGTYVIHWSASDPRMPFPDAYIPLAVVGTLVASGVAGGAEWPVIDVDQVRPEMESVAILERTRTVDQDDGTIKGVFTARTSPTSGEVEDLIDTAVDDVLAELRPWIDPARYRQLKKVIQFYAAMLIEGSFYDEQGNAETGGRVKWSSEYNDALKNLQARIEQDLVENNLLGTMEPRDSAILA